MCYCNKAQSNDKTHLFLYARTFQCSNDLNKVFRQDYSNPVYFTDCVPWFDQALEILNDPDKKCTKIIIRDQYMKKYQGITQKV